MSATGPGLERDRQADGASVVRAWQAWAAQGSGKALGAFVSGVIFGYAGNLLAANLIPQGVLSTGIMWTASSSVVFGMLGYARTAGVERLAEGIAAGPETIARILSRDGAAARSHLLWGAGVATLSSLVVSSLSGIMVGVSLLTAVPSAAGKLVASLLAPTAPGVRMDHPTGFLVGLLGAAAALFIGALIGDAKIKLGVAGVCMVLGWLLGSGGGRSKGTASILLIVGAGLAIQAGLDLFHPLAAFAQDEGGGGGGESGPITPPQYGDGPRPIPGEMGVPQYGDGPRPIPGEMGNLLQGGGWWSEWGDDLGGGFGGGAGATLGWLLGSFGGWLRTGGAGFSDPGFYDPPAPPQAPPPPYRPPPPRPAAPPPASVPDTADDLPSPPPAPAAGPPPYVADTADDLPATAPDTVDDLPPAPGGGVEEVAAPAAGDDALDDLPDLTYAPATRDAMTAGDAEDDLPAPPAPRPGEGELLLDENGDPVVIAPLANSDQPTVDPAGDPPPTDATEETEAQQAARLLRDLKSRAPGADAAVIERVLGGIDLNNPSPADLDKLNRLAKAAINRIEGAEAYPAAVSDAALYDNCLWGTTIAAAIGQGVASVVWGPATAGAIYGAAGGMDVSLPLDVMLDRMSTGAAFGGALGLAFGAAGKALPKILAEKAPGLAAALNNWDIPLGKALGSTGVGAAVSGGWAWMAGEKAGDVKLAALAGGVGGLVGNYAAQEAIRATELAKLHATFDTTQGVLTEGMAIEFGQKAVSPSFSSAGKYKGAKIEDVAIRLAVGGDDMGGVVHPAVRDAAGKVIRPADVVKLPDMEPFSVLDPADINVQYMWANGKPFVINNRSTTTLSLAGKKPVNPQDMTGKLPRWGPDSEVSVLTRLTEMGNQPSTVSKVRLVDKRSSPIAYEVPLYDPNQAR
jgi:hypothetical protein